MRLISCALLTVILFLCQISMGVQPVLGQAAPIQPEETITLFNGKDLSGFSTWLMDDHQEDPSRVFTVVDQIDGQPAIRVSGEGFGGFVTRANPNEKKRSGDDRHKFWGQCDIEYSWRLNQRVR